MTNNYKKMLNRFSLFLLMLLIAGSISAQSLLKGKVSDQEGNPLIGVNVLLHQSKTGTITQQDGSYQLPIPSNLKVLTLEYSYIGYRTVSKSIDLTEASSDTDYTLDVSLVESPLELQEITVTAGFVKEKDEVPYPIETVRKIELLSSGELTWPKALARTPGVYFSSFGTGGGQPIIRGLSNNNLVVLNNGVKQEVYQFSSNHPFMIDEFAASHIEIIKGPASLQYGSDAAGGVINVIRERPAAPNSIEGDFTSQYFTNTSGLSNSLGIKGSLGKFFFGVRGSMKSHKDFTDGDDKLVPNTRINDNNLTANAGLRTDVGIFSVNYNYTDAEYGIQNGPLLNLFSNPLSSTLLQEERQNEVWYQDLVNHFISSNNTIFLGKNTLDIDFGYQLNTRELIGGGINPQGQLVQPQLVSMQMNTFTYKAKLTVPSGDNNFVFGVNGANLDNDADETKPNVVMLDAKINDIGLYAIGDFGLAENLTLTTGLRYDYRNMESFPIATANTDRFKIDNTYNNVNGSLGVAYNFSENQFLKVNLARGFRSPNLPELTQNGIHAGRYERGNPDLEAQSNYQIDLTYHLHNDWATLNIAPFYNIVNNFLYVVMTDENAPIGGGQVFQYVQNDATLTGGEVALDIHPVDWLGIHGSYSMVRANITDDAEGIEHPTFTPADRLTGEIKLEQKKIGLLNRPYLSFEVMHFFEQDRTGQNEAVTPAYTLLNARLGTSIAVGGKEMDVFVVGNNLTNTAYIDHLSITKPLNLNMIGRNIMFGLRLPFGFYEK